MHNAKLWPYWAFLLALIVTNTHPTHEEFAWFFRAARAPRIRTMREFAEAEIVLPTGPYEGLRFRTDRQPFTALWFDAIDSGRWNRFAATGPSQSGKTLAAFVTPILYHLFEIGETVVCGIPDMDMAADKWAEDLLPVIERTRYRDLIPAKGPGSRGGSKLEAVRFRNGTTLRFMSGGGSDKSRAGFTSRVLVVTEVDGLDTAGESSREADKLKQMEARTRSFGNRKRIYLECTVSTPQGRIWQEYQRGTASQILLLCPHCHQAATLERKHLAGYQGAESELAARREAAFFCPVCGEIWTEDERRQANANARLLHAGQTLLPTGEVDGSPKETNTLGFRWTAANNLFVSAADVAADEWLATQADDEDNAEKELCQFVWAIPYEPRLLDAARPEAATLARRFRAKLPRGLVPADTEHLTAGVDLGKWLAHWVVTAWLPDATPHVVDYGRFEIPTAELGLDLALLVGLREFRDLAEAGWTVEGEGEQPRSPDQVWIDSNYQGEVVIPFCRESGTRYRPIRGRGSTQTRQEKYHRPKSTGNQVIQLGEHYHFVREPNSVVPVVEIDADYWKAFLHERLTTPLDASGAWTLFTAMPDDHKSFCKHLTAEQRHEEWEPGRGLVIRWQAIRRANHWFDASYYACAAAHFCGARTLPPVPPPPANPAPAATPLLTPDGRPFFINERED